MHPNHRRNPSVPNISYDSDQTLSFTSNFSIDPKMIQNFKIQGKDISKIISNPMNSQKNHDVQFGGTSLFIDHSSFLSSSAENLIKDLNKFNDFSKLPEQNIQDSHSDLINIVREILKKQNIKILALKKARKNIKIQLFELFCNNEIETEKRDDQNRCSRDTIEGPGSALLADDQSYSKFESKRDTKKIRK